MIVKMSKYTFVLYYQRRAEFLEKLQELGLVDITVTGWEPNEHERSLLGALEQHKSAADRFAAMKSDRAYVAGEPFADGKEAFENYVKAISEIESLKGRIEKAEKEATELAVWGDFSTEKIAALAEAGVHLRFYTMLPNDYARLTAEHGDDLTIEKIGETGSAVYFVVVTIGEEEPNIDAQQLKEPTMTVTGKREQIAGLKRELEGWNEVLARCAASADMIEAHGRGLADELEMSRAMRSGRDEAEGTLVVMEGWATEESTARIDSMLDECSDVVYVKERPMPEDDTPVVLHNNRFARLFELIGNFYSLPKYGSIDLTPYFAPFYMLFFGFCLGDAGYGLFFVVLSLLLMKIKPGMKSLAWLAFCCGMSTMLFGFLAGSFFGVQLAEQPLFADYKDKFLTTDVIFYLALVVGIVQILFAMVLRVVNISIQSGFKYALGPLGWLIVLVASIAAIFLPAAGVSGFSMHSPVYLVLLGVGLVLMFFLNTPGRNPLINFGSGLWDTYNNVIGLMGDLLSYIRLFALCLSGGTLALVFNDLAVGLAPDIPVVKQLVAVLILLFGHSINLFMSSLGSFVHPMRLTFVEFYKNAGFEAAQRPFTPFRKNNNQ